MPLAADGTLVSGTSAFDADDHRRFQRIALGSIPALAGAHAAPFFRIRFFHASELNENRSIAQRDELREPNRAVFTRR
jgi:hypothetical protein